MHLANTTLLREQEKDIQASLVAQDDLQQQLQSMQDELTQLETDLSSRDTEAAELSRKLAHARTRLGDPTAAPPANGTARTSVPGETRARLGKCVLQMIILCGDHTTGTPSMLCQYVQSHRMHLFAVAEQLGELKCLSSPTLPSSCSFGRCRQQG